MLTEFATITNGVSAAEANEPDPVKRALTSPAVAHGAYIVDLPNKIDVLDQVYIDAKLPIAKRQRALAAFHLAKLLNTLLAGNTLADIQPQLFNEKRSVSECSGWSCLRGSLGDNR